MLFADYAAATFRARVHLLADVGECRSAFLKEWGRVKVLVLVVSSAAGDAGARGSRAVVKVGLSGLRTRVGRSWIGQTRLPGIPSLTTRAAWCPN